MYDDIKKNKYGNIIPAFFGGDSDSEPEITITTSFILYRIQFITESSSISAPNAPIWSYDITMEY